jgi:hypothetical protein
VIGLFAVAVVLPSVLVVREIERNPKLSSYDEFAHLDYVVKVTRHVIPRTGDFSDPLTLRTMACAKIDYPGVHLPSCRAKSFRFDEFPGGAYNHEAQQPPLYYIVTAATRAAATHLGVHNYLTAARLGGVVWLIAALLLLWCAGRLLGVAAWPLLAAMLVLVAAPAPIYFASIVSNDASAIFAGAAVLLAAAIVGRDPAPWGTAILVVTGSVVALLKPTNSFAVVTVAAFLLVIGSRSSDGGWRGAVRSWLRTGGALLAGALVATGGWIAIADGLAYKDPRVLPIDLFAAQASYLLNAATGAIPAHTLTHPVQILTSELVRDLFVVTAGAALFATRRAWYHWLPAIGAVVLLVGGFGLGLSIWISLRMDPGVVPRYGLSVLPLFTVCLAELARRGRVVWLVAALGIVTATTTLYVLV